MTKQETIERIANLKINELIQIGICFVKRIAKGTWDVSTNKIHGGDFWGTPQQAYRDVAFRNRKAGVQTCDRGPTLKDARAFAKKCGCTLTKGLEDYRVNLKGAPEASAYYTTDLEDAMDTAAAMENNLINGGDAEEKGEEQPPIYNKYGEEVRLHGPVCSRCHQRVAKGKLPHSVKAAEGDWFMNVCDHCLTDSEKGAKEVSK